MARRRLSVSVSEVWSAGLCTVLVGRGPAGRAGSMRAAPASTRHAAKQASAVRSSLRWRARARCTAWARPRCIWGAGENGCLVISLSSPFSAPEGRAAGFCGTGRPQCAKKHGSRGGAHCFHATRKPRCVFAFLHEKSLRFSCALAWGGRCLQTFFGAARVIKRGKIPKTKRLSL